MFGNLQDIDTLLVSFNLFAYKKMCETSNLKKHHEPNNFPQTG